MLAIVQLGYTYLDSSLWHEVVGNTLESITLDGAIYEKINTPSCVIFEISANYREKMLTTTQGPTLTPICSSLCQIISDKLP